MDEFEQMLAEMAQQKRAQQQAQHLLGGALGEGPARPSDLQVQPANQPVPAPVPETVGFEAKMLPGQQPRYSQESPRLVGVTGDATAQTPQFQTSTRWGSTSNKLDKGWMEDYRLSQEMLGRQLEHRTQQTEEQAGRVEGLSKELATDQKERSDFYATVRDDYVKRNIDPKETKLFKMVEAQAAKEAEGVDDEKWWGTRDDAQKFFAVLATALGGFAQGLSGGRVQNTAAQMISKAIDRNIAAQKSNLMAGRAGIASQQGLLAAVYRRVGDIDRSANIARVGLITLAQSRMKQMEASGAKTMASVNAGVTAAQMNVNKAMAMVQLTKKSITGGGSRTPVNPADAAMKAAQLRILNLRGDALEGAGAAKKGKALGVVMGQLAPDMSQVESLAKQQADTNVGEYVVGQVAGWFGIGTAAGATEAARNAITMGYVKAYQGARASDMDLKMFKRLVPQTISTLKGYSRALQTMEAMAIKNFASDLYKAQGEGQISPEKSIQLLAQKKAMAKAVTGQLMAIYESGQ